MRTSRFEPGRAVAPIPHTEVKLSLEKTTEETIYPVQNFWGKNQKEAPLRLSLLK